MGSLGISRINLIPRVHLHTFFKKKKPPKPLKLGRGHTKYSSLGVPRTVQRKRLSASVNQGIGYIKNQWIVARPAHLGALVAAKPRISRHDAKRSCSRTLARTTSLDGCVAAASLPSVAPLTTLRPHSQAVPARMQLKQQTRRGSKQSRDTAAQQSRTQQFQMSNRRAAPHSTRTTTPNPHLLRLSAPQLQAQLFRLSDRLRLQRFFFLKKKKCLAQVALPLGRSKDWAAGAAQASSAVCVEHFLDVQLVHGEPAAPKPPVRAPCLRSRRLGRTEARGPGIKMEPRGLTETTIQTSFFFQHRCCVSGRSVAQDVCVASSNAAAAAREDAAQAASGTQIPHITGENIPDLQAQGIIYRPWFWTAHD